MIYNIQNMKVILNTENTFQAIKLREQIIKGIKGDIEAVIIDTWSYTKSVEKFDIVCHNPNQYLNDPEKNVLFKLDVDGSFILLSIVWWKKNPEPSDEMKCYHVGRLVEMLLRHFRNSFIKLSVVD